MIEAHCVPENRTNTHHTPLEPVFTPSACPPHGGDTGVKRGPPDTTILVHLFGRDTVHRRCHDRFVQVTPTPFPPSRPARLHC